MVPHFRSVTKRCSNCLVVLTNTERQARYQGAAEGWRVPGTAGQRTGESRVTTAVSPPLTPTPTGSRPARHPESSGLPRPVGVVEMVADKEYHSDATLVALGAVGVRSYVSEQERGRRCWRDKKTGEKPPEKAAVQGALYGNPRRVRVVGVVACNAAGGEVVDGLSRTCMRRAVCVGCGCAATRMSASPC